MRNEFKIKIADMVIHVSCINSFTRDYCSDYMTVDSSDFSVFVKQEDIDYERQKYEGNALLEGKNIIDFSDAYLESLAVYRKIAEQLLTYDTLLFHGSVIAVEGSAFLFTAKSGTGKSTHTRLWREVYGNKAIMVNDDKPLLKITEEGVIAYGTPWNGKHRLGTNISVPLKAICVLERDTENHIKIVTKNEVYNMLLQQSHRPTDAAKLMKTLQLIDRLANNVRLYKLGCNMDRDAAKVAYEGMK